MQTKRLNIGLSPDDFRSVALLYDAANSIRRHDRCEPFALCIREHYRNESMLINSDKCRFVSVFFQTHDQRIGSEALRLLHLLRRNWGHVRTRAKKGG